MHRFLTGHVQLGIPSLEVDRVTNLLDHDFRCYPTFRHSHLSFEWSSWLPPYRTRLRITPCSGDHAPTRSSLEENSSRRITSSLLLFSSTASLLNPLHRSAQIAKLSKAPAWDLLFRDLSPKRRGPSRSSLLFISTNTSISRLIQALT